MSYCQNLKPILGKWKESVEALKKCCLDYEKSGSQDDYDKFVSLKKSCKNARLEYEKVAFELDEFNQHKVIAREAEFLR